MLKEDQLQLIVKNGFVFCFFYYFAIGRGVCFINDKNLNAL